MRVGVIGGGLSGLAAAQVLADDGVDVVVFDAQALGGGRLGLDVADSVGVLHRVDVGATDFTPERCPALARLLGALGVGTRPLDGDTTATLLDGTLAWCTRGDELEAGPAVADAASFLDDVARFREGAHEVLASGELSAWTAAQYLARKGYGADFERLWFGARARAIASAPGDEPLALTMGAAVAVWHAQGLVGDVPAVRHGVDGGLHHALEVWVRRLEKQGVSLLPHTRVLGLDRDRTHVDVLQVDPLGRHGRTRVDAVVLAIPPREVIPLLDGAERDEQLAWLACPSRRVRVVVHRDQRLLPRVRGRWGTFNLTAPSPERPGPPTVTIWANRQQRLPEEAPDVFVTLNPLVDPEPGKVLLERFGLVPVDGAQAADALAELDALQGQRRTYACAPAVTAPWLDETALVAGEATARRLLADVRKPTRRKGRPTITQEALAPPWVPGAGLFLLTGEELHPRGVGVVTELTKDGVTLRCPGGVQLPASVPVRLGVVRGALRKLTVFQAPWLGSRRETGAQLVRVGTPAEAVTPPRARPRYAPHRWRATARIGSDVLKGMVVDISATGLALDCARQESPRALLGRRGTVTLRADDAMHRLDFVIARQRETPGGVRLGLAFVEEDGPALASLELSLVRVAAAAPASSGLPVAATVVLPKGPEPVTVRSLSTGGLVVAAAALPGSVGFVLPLPTRHEPLHLEGVVRRGRKAGGVAVDFFGVDAKAATALADYVSVVERLSH